MFRKCDLRRLLFEESLVEVFKLNYENQRRCLTSLFIALSLKFIKLKLRFQKIYLKRSLVCVCNVCLNILQLQLAVHNCLGIKNNKLIIFIDTSIAKNLHHFKYMYKLWFYPIVSNRQATEPEYSNIPRTSHHRNSIYTIDGSSQ